MSSDPMVRTTVPLELTTADVGCRFRSRRTCMAKLWRRPVEMTTSIPKDSASFRAARLRGLTWPEELRSVPSRSMAMRRGGMSF